MGGDASTLGTTGAGLSHLQHSLASVLPPNLQGAEKQLEHNGNHRVPLNFLSKLMRQPYCFQTSMRAGETKEKQKFVKSSNKSTN